MCLYDTAFGNPDNNTIPATFNVRFFLFIFLLCANICDITILLFIITIDFFFELIY